MYASGLFYLNICLGWNLRASFAHAKHMLHHCVPSTALCCGFSKWVWFQNGNVFWLAASKDSWLEILEKALSVQLWAERMCMISVMPSWDAVKLNSEILGSRVLGRMNVQLVHWTRIWTSTSEKMWVVGRGNRRPEEARTPKSESYPLGTDTQECMKFITGSKTKERGSRIDEGKPFNCKCSYWESLRIMLIWWSFSL